MTLTVILAPFHFFGAMMETYSAKTHKVRRNWLLFDAENKNLGRLASEIAKHLQGKHKPEYTRHIDTGDYIVVINAEKIGVTGNKLQDKVYYRHSNYPGGIKSKTLDKMLKETPERVLQIAIKGMLPKGPLGRKMYEKLKVYAGAQHPHAAQQPQQKDII